MGEGGRAGAIRMAIAAAAAVILLLLPATALADVTITFTPPAGADVNAQDTPPQYFRTDNPQPTIGIEVSGAATLHCRLDMADVPCGPALPGCAAALCASFRPASPLAGRPPSVHDLDVEATDSHGNTISGNVQGFTVDLTPPRIDFYGIDVEHSLRPLFNFVVSDDQPSAGFITVNDTASCSFGRLHAPQQWTRCPPTGGSPGARYRLPPRHIDYRLWIRGVDDFGRATVIHRDYDPVPCAVHASPPRHLRDVALSGVTVRVQCSYVHGVELGLWPVAVNGRVYAHSPAQTVATRLLLGGLRVHGHGSHWTARPRLRLDSQFVGQALRFHSTRFLLTACPDWPAHDNPCGDRSLDSSWSYLTFTAN
jgi:hypothetical protein